MTTGGTDSTDGSGARRDRPRRLPLDVPAAEAAGLAKATQRFRCSVDSEARDEPLTATASMVSAFLLLEDPGPWGPAVLQCLRVPEPVRARAAGWERELGIRPLLIRRMGRSAGGARRVFVVNARHGWAQTARLDSLAAVADWDLSGATGPHGVGLEPHDEPILLACTHGRHDACCAERGRPLVRALAAEFGDLVWESSHLGGDRFAANLLVLPDGHAYGRLDPASGPRVVADHFAGRLSLEHLRGRTTVPWVSQYAEQVVRERLGETRLDAVTSRVMVRRRGHAVVQVRVGDEVQEVVVDVDRAPEARLTCGSERTSRAPRYSAPALD